MLLMVLSVSNAAFCQLIDKSGNKLVIASETKQSDEPLSKSELVSVYKYLVELQTVRSNYNIEQKKNDYLNQQIAAYQNQLELKDDMNANLQAYAEQVKAKWYQSSYAILVYIVGAVAITYAVSN